MFETQLNNLKNNRTIQSIGKFLSWWKTELLGGLPDGVREFLDPPKPKLYVRLIGDELVLSSSPDSDELLRVALAEDPAIASQTLAAEIAKFEDRKININLLLDADQVLAVHRKVPAAAVDNLRQVIGFEMDRYTPFSRDQVRYDVRIDGEANSKGQLPVELVYSPANDIDKLIRVATDRGLVLDAVDVIESRDDEVTTRGVNLLERHERARHSQRQLLLNLGLAGLFVALLYSLMWISLGKRDAAIEAYQVQVGEARVASARVRELRDTLDDAREAASFLDQTRGQKARVIDLLREVTNLLPDDVWLTRFQVTQNVLRLNGEAPKAETLIATLAESDRLDNVTVDGAITAGSNGKERFRLKMDIMTASEEANDGAVAAR